VKWVSRIEEEKKKIESVDFSHFFFLSCSDSQITSLLQKCIRRGELQTAVKVAHAFMQRVSHILLCGFVFLFFFFFGWLNFHFDHTIYVVQNLSEALHQVVMTMMRDCVLHPAMPAIVFIR
jgi:hypothetical protein